MIILVNLEFRENLYSLYYEHPRLPQPIISQPCLNPYFFFLSHEIIWKKETNYHRVSFFLQVICIHYYSVGLCC